MNDGEKSLDKEDRNAEVANYLFKKELLLKYMESGSGRAVSIKRRAELDVWLWWTNAFRNLHCEKREELWIPTLEGRYLMM